MNTAIFTYTMEHGNDHTAKPFCIDLRVMDQDGEPWFVAKDVCNVLGLNTNNLRRDLDDDEIKSLKLRASGSANLVVNEPGLYSLILRSRKPEAKRFKRWVTHEVLPTIRKTGGTYMTDAAEKRFAADPQAEFTEYHPSKAESGRTR